MDRRAFIRRLATGLAATAAMSAVDPEFLLWRPGAKTIVLPAVTQWVPVTIGVGGGSTFVTPEWIMREAFCIFENSLVLVKAANCNYIDGALIGATIYKPAQYRMSA